jgi:hypothetical protein
MTDASSLFAQLVPGVRVEGPLLPEPVEVLSTSRMGASIKLVGRGLRTNQVHKPILTAVQLAQLAIIPQDEPFDGDALRFRLGIEAHRLGLAYEYDPYPSLTEDDVRACVVWAAECSHAAERVAQERQGNQAPPVGSANGFKDFLRSMPNVGDDADFERLLFGIEDDDEKRRSP